MFTKPMYYDNIDTLAALDESNMKISIESNELRNIFGSDEAKSETVQSLSKKFIDFTPLSTIWRVAQYRNICSVERFSEIPILVEVIF